MKTPLRAISTFAFAMSLTSPLWGQFAYVANELSGNISGYSVNTATGALTAVTGSPFATGTLPVSIVLDPTGRFAYWTTLVPNGIAAYSVSSNGALTSISGSPFTAGTDPSYVTIDPSGKFLYAANGNSSNVSGFKIDSVTGALTPITGSPFSSGAIPAAVTVHPNGKFAYVMNSGSKVTGYAVDASGALTPFVGSPYAAGGFPTSMAIDPSGKYAYVPSQTTADIYAYTIDPATGNLGTVPGSPFATGKYAYSSAVDPTGKFLYVTNAVDNQVAGYAIDAATGALTALAASPFPAGDYPNFIALDAAGKFAYVAHGGSNNVWVYAINSSTGALTPIVGSPFGAGTHPISIAMQGCTMPPSITDISAVPAILWPPNKKMVDVQINFNVAAQCGIPACTLSVASNEAVSAAGDWTVVGAHSLQLRADRNGTGNGRIYTVTIGCQDTAGHSTSKTTTVLVPHDQ